MVQYDVRKIRAWMLVAVSALGAGLAGACSSDPDESLAPQEVERQIARAPVPPTLADTEIVEAPAEEPVPEEMPEGPPFAVGGEIERPELKGSSHIEGLVDMLRTGRYSWGACIFGIIIDEKGEVGEVVFLKPEDLAPEVRQVVVEAVRKWEFSPATRDGRPVAVHYNLLVHHCPYRRME